MKFTRDFSPCKHQSLVAVLLKLRMLSTKMFSIFLEWNQIFLSIYRITGTNKRWNFGQIDRLLKTTMTTSKLLPMDIVMNPNVCTSWGSLLHLQLRINSLQWWPMQMMTVSYGTFVSIHTNYESLRHMSCLRLAEGLPQINPPSGVCEGCVMGKHHRESFPKSN